MKRQKLTENKSSTAKRQKMASDPIAFQTISSPVKVSLLTLNADCLIKIADYLRIDDLLNMCIGNDKLTNVLKHFVKGRLFDFDELSKCCHILDLFKIFGQQMTKMKIGERNIQYKNRRFSKFDEILKLITTYCTEDSLKCLEIQYNYGTVIDMHLLNISMPFFRSVEKFKIHETDESMGSMEPGEYFSGHTKFNPSVNNFIEQVVQNAANINSIEMTNLRINGRFFNLDHICNLKTLGFIGCNVKEPNGLISFIQNKPKLMSFTFEETSLQGMDNDTSTSSNTVFVLVTNNVATLEALHFSLNFLYIDDENECNLVRHEIEPDFGLLAKFNQLKTFSMDTITARDWEILAQQNRIEKISIKYFPEAHLLDWDLLQSFTSLKVIRLLRFADQWFLPNLPNLTECHLVFRNLEEFGIEDIVENVKKLSIMRILFKGGKFSVNLYLSLLKLRLRHGVQTVQMPLVIYVEKDIFDKFFPHLGPMYTPNIITVKPYDSDN